MPNFVLLSDPHCQERTPPCRTDNFFEAMDRKFEEVFEFCKRHSATLLIAGDLFDVNPPTEYIKGWLAEKIRKYGIRIIVIFGQHDLLHHSLKSWERTGIAVLFKAGLLEIAGPKPIKIGNVCIYGCHFGEEPPVPSVKDKSCVHLLMIHKMLIEKKLWAAQNALSGENFLRTQPVWNIVLSGDNHKTFQVQTQTQRLINCGSMMRRRSDQKDHKPCYFSYNSDNDSIKQIFFKIDYDAVSTERNDNIAEDENRTMAFVEQIRDFNVSLSPKESFENFFEQHQTDPITQDKLWEHFKGESHAERD